MFAVDRDTANVFARTRAHAMIILDIGIVKASSMQFRQSGKDAKSTPCPLSAAANAAANPSKRRCGVGVIGSPKAWDHSVQPTRGPVTAIRGN